MGLDPIEISIIERARTILLLFIVDGFLGGSWLKSPRGTKNRLILVCISTLIVQKYAFFPLYFFSINQTRQVKLLVLPFRDNLRDTTQQLNDHAIYHIKVAVFRKIYDLIVS